MVVENWIKNKWLGSVLAFGVLMSGLEARMIPTDLSETIAKEAPYYSIERFKLPEDLHLEVTGLTLMPSERIAVLTRRGEIWIADSVFDADTSKQTYRKFADGLQEPLGIAYSDGWLYVTQRPELSRLKDSNGDGSADIYETVCDDWGVSGDYHEFAFGSAPDRDGNIWVTLCLTSSRASKTYLRGWGVRVTPEGEMIPTVSGIRSPGGVGEDADGNMYYCDNQGYWNGTSSLKHLKPGSFQGSPAGTNWYDVVDTIGKRPAELPLESRIETERANIPNLVPPAILFPHGRMGQSPTGIVWDKSEGKFGPFAKQMFVADYTRAQIHRVFLEEVNGVKQGACFPFVSGFGSGIIGLLMTEEGTLFAGGQSRGWPTQGVEPFAFERLHWTGKIPFEILEMRATIDGFDLEFTQAVDEKSAEALESYSVEAWTYIYREQYGSPEVDKVYPAVVRIDVSEDGRTVSLAIPERIKGHVHMLELPGLKSNEGEPLLHPIAYYTLNEIPED